MKIFQGKSADIVWRKAFNEFNDNKKYQRHPSRIGPTKEILHSGFVIEDPRQRWIFSRKPTLNIAFALAEVIWTMNGRNDSKFLTYWNRELSSFAGSGKTLYGAYGFRLRKRNGLDQLENAYQTLKSNSISRQVVLEIWDSNLDLPKVKGLPRNEDVPCNIVSLLKVRDGKLEWLQVLRSNDLFRGLPYDFIQFTYLQEILAGWLKLKVGSYNQISDSLHLYLADKVFCKKGKPPRNSDNISVNKKQSEYLFFALGRKIDLFISEKLSKRKHEAITYWPNAPIAYKNILFILSAEAARRRGWQELSNKTILKCTNGVFKNLFFHWLKRTNKVIKTH